MVGTIYHHTINYTDCRLLIVQVGSMEGVEDTMREDRLR